MSVKKKSTAGTAAIPAGYSEFVDSLKRRIRSARLDASLAVNRELLVLYYSIGYDLHQKTGRGSWGSSIIDKISADLHASFPGMEGLSPRNLRRMRAFYRTYPLDDGSRAIWPRAVAKIDIINWPPAVANLPWSHNVALFETIKDKKLRVWYAEAALQYGWSRDVLLMQIENKLHSRKGKALTNFSRTLPEPQSDLAQQITKDPYHFEFLDVRAETNEKAIELGLIEHLKDFLIELGIGFAYLGNQFHVTAGRNDYYIDLLFYHIHLRCYVVVELKTGDFKPEYAGKLNFYLSIIDDTLRHHEDNPSIGLLLCRSKDRVEVEYALRDIKKPIGVAEWKTNVMRTLPDRFAGKLPTADDLEKELLKIRSQGKTEKISTKTNLSGRKRK